MVRKAVALVLEADGVTVDQRPDIEGITYVVGSESTVVIYDKGDRAWSGAAFLGWNYERVARRRPDVYPRIGACLSRQRAAFWQRSINSSKDTGVKPFTPYAERNPKWEFFAEAFYLFETDPEWLKSSHPDVFQWFDTLSTTGKPPPKKK